MVKDLLDDEGLLDLRNPQDQTDPKAVTEELRSKRDRVPDRNKALGEWAQRLGDGSDLRDRASHAGEECHLCTAAGRNTCQQCDRKACASHFWVMFGLCRSCATEEGVKSWHHDGRPEDSNWLGGTS